MSVPTRRPRAAHVRRSARAVAETLESRQLLATTTVSDLVHPVGPQNATLGKGSVSDGTYAYYAGPTAASPDLFGIYRTDGTAAGTTQLGTVPRGVAPKEFTLVDGRLFFTAAETESYASELYTVDNPANFPSVRKVGNFAVDGGYLSARDLVAFNGRLYFIGHPTGITAQLYSTDGTPGGTTLVRDVGTGDNLGGPDVARVGNEIYFSAHDGDENWTVYRGDGTTFSPLKSVVGSPGGFVKVNDRVVFNVRRYNSDLWASDGTPDGTQPVGVRGGMNLTSVGDFAVFHDENTEGDGMRNVYVTDGTAAGTRTEASLHLPDFYASFFAVAGGAVYVPSGSPGFNGLFRLTRDQTTRLWDGEVYEAYGVGDRVYFAGSYRQPGGGPFHQHAVAVTDGTPAGTWILEDRDDTVGGGIPTGFRGVRAGVVYGLGPLYTLPADAPGLAKYSGHVFQDLDRDGVYDPGEPAEYSATLNPAQQIAPDGSFSALAGPPFTTHVSAQPSEVYVRPTTPTVRPLNTARGQANTGMDFGFVRINVVVGTVRVDSNFDDVASEIEPPAPGRTVFADLDLDGVLDEGEPSGVSGANGAYQIDDVPAGQIAFRVVPKPGEYASAPVAPPTLGLTTGGGLYGLPSFGVTPAPPRNYVSGRMFQDDNRNGAFDEGEAFIAGGRIWIDYDDDGALDANEPSAQSTAGGDALLRITSPGTYRLRYQPPAGWAATAPMPMVTLAPGQRVLGLRLPVAVPAPSGATLAGVVFFDVDADGVRDPGENVRQNLRVYLDADGDFAFDPTEQSINTDSLGRFAFVDLAPGRYAVRQQLPPNFMQTTPAPGQAIEIDLAAGQQRTDLLFGSRGVPQGQGKTITAFAYPDHNVNGVNDGNDEFNLGNPGVGLFIDSNNDGFFQQTERTSSTGGTGIVFPDVAPGRYHLRPFPFFVDGVRFTGASPDGSYVVDVPVTGNPATVPVGFYRVNGVVQSAWLEAAGLPFRVRVNFEPVSPQTLGTARAALTITDAQGNRVTPTRVVAAPAPPPHQPNNGPVLSNLYAEFAQALPAGTYTLRIPGAALKGSPGLPTPSDYTFTFAYPPAAATVVGRHVFYNRSAADGHTPAVGPAEDAAIDPTKSALLPGQAATLANVTNYVRGVNGIMIDVAGLPRGISLVAPSDFTIRTSVDGINWSTAGIVTPAITIRRGAGVDGSDRITLAWPDMPARNQWLNVVLRATPNTGLAAPDSFFYGNLVGETFDAATGNPRVDAADVSRVRAGQNRAGRAPGALDFNRDRAVNAADLAVARNAAGRTLVLLPAAATSVPIGVDLLPESDTGFSSTDNVTRLDNGHSSRALRFAVTGTVAGAAVTLYAGGDAIGTATATGPVTVVTTNGAAALSGLTTVSARQTPAGGAPSNASPSLTINVIVAPPPTPAAPDLTAASDGGTSAADDLTNDNTPTLSIAGASSYFRVFRDGVQVGGNYEQGTAFSHPGAPLADGVYVYRVVGLDPAGNESAPSDPLTIRIDTASPSPVAATTPVTAAGTADHTFTVTYSDAGGIDAATLGDGDVIVTGPNGFAQDASLVSVDPATGGDSPRTATYRVIAPGGSWDRADNGEYLIGLRPNEVFDRAGNAASRPNLGAFTVAANNLLGVDLLASSDSGVSDSDNVTHFNASTANNWLTFSVSNTEPFADVFVYANGQVLGASRASGFDTLVYGNDFVLADGVYTITARQVSPNGTVSAPTAPITLVVDTVASAPVVTLQPGSDTGAAGDGVTRDTTPTFDVAVAEAGRIDLSTDAPGGVNPSLVVNGGGTHALGFTPDSAGFSPDALTYYVGRGDSNVPQVYGADFNRDGLTDLVTHDDRSLHVSVLVGNGDGTFRATDGFTEGDSFLTAVADFTGDGKLDLIFRETFAYSLSVYPGNGDGTFAMPVNTLTPRVGDLAAADFDRDGRLDVATTDLDAQGVWRLAVRRGVGDGTFGTGVIHAPQGLGPIMRVAAGDFDGDGDADLAVGAIEPERLAVFVNDGAGAFQLGWSESLGQAGGRVADKIQVADVNRDGKGDLVVNDGAFGDGPRGYSVLLGNGDGTFQPRQTTATQFSPGLPTITDFDRDGIVDLVSAHFYARGNGDGTFRLTPAMGGGGHPSVTADFDRDGRHDIAVASGLGRILVYRGTGGPLLPRTHRIIARFEDLAGNRSPDSTPLLLTIEPAAPSAAAAEDPAGRKRYRPRANPDLLA